MSRKRSIQGRSDPGIILRQPCRYYLKGTCTSSPCEYWHPPECQLYKLNRDAKQGDKCLFPHHEVDEEPNKKPTKRDHSLKEEKATTEMQWLLRKLDLRWVVSRKSRSYWILIKEANKPGKPDTDAGWWARS